jgi:tRNA-dihydrouridine synthase 2
MEEAKSVNIFDNCICLAPMVRAGSLPLRSLCLKYGATLVWGEEIIDKRIRSASRVVNTELNTIDFIVDENVLVFRTAEVEKGKVVFQMGTSDPVVAVEAAKVVANDVAVIDINMGCPKVLRTL